MTTGLFLGAGAYYEVGMPLVWELTSELKAWLTPDRSFELSTKVGYPRVAAIQMR